MPNPYVKILIERPLICGAKRVCEVERTLTTGSSIQSILPPLPLFPICDASPIVLWPSSLRKVAHGCQRNSGLVVHDAQCGLDNPCVPRAKSAVLQGKQVAVEDDDESRLSVRHYYVLYAVG